MALNEKQNKSIWLMKKLCPHGIGPQCCPPLPLSLSTAAIRSFLRLNACRYHFSPLASSLRSTDKATCQSAAGKARVSSRQAHPLRHSSPFNHLRIASARSMFSSA